MAIATPRSSPTSKTLYGLLLTMLLCLLSGSLSLPIHHRISLQEDISDEVQDLLNAFRGHQSRSKQEELSAKDVFPIHLGGVPRSESFRPSVRRSDNVRSAGSASSCPPSISERECNYELMAVWMRILMKENQ